jgi:6-phosphofructokinase
MNQVVDSIVKRHSLLATFASTSAGPGATKPDVPDTLEIVGYIGGYAGVLGHDTVRLKHSATDKRALDPGCFLKCLRTDKTEEVLQCVAEEVAKGRYDIVYTVGGEGTQRAALAVALRLDALCQGEASGTKRPVIVAGPKTRTPRP